MVADKAILLAVFAILLIGGIQAFDAGASAAADDTSITNESWTSDPGTYVTLDGSNEGFTYNDSVTVRNATNATMAEGTDYEWNSSDGTILALSGGDLDPSQQAHISYQYEKQDATQQGITSLFTNVFGAADALIIVLLLALMAAGMRVFGGI